LNLFVFVFFLIKNVIRFLSNWALKGVLNNEETGMFIQVKPDIEDEDTSSRRNWDRFTIDESIEVPIFLNKYKSDILNCGKTINFFKKFNDLVSKKKKIEIILICNIYSK
jgi:hypothetical protein